MLPARREFPFKSARKFLAFLLQKFRSSPRPQLRGCTKDTRSKHTIAARTGIMSDTRGLTNRTSRAVNNVLEAGPSSRGRHALSRVVASARESTLIYCVTVVPLTAPRVTPVTLSAYVSSSALALAVSVVSTTRTGGKDNFLTLACPLSILPTLNAQRSRFLFLHTPLSSARYLERNRFFYGDPQPPPLRVRFPPPRIIYRIRVRGRTRAHSRAHTEATRSPFFGNPVPFVFLPFCIRRCDLCHGGKERFATVYSSRLPPLTSPPVRSLIVLPCECSPCTRGEDVCSRVSPSLNFLQ